MKKGLKIAIIIVVILLILTLGGIAFVYFFTDTFKSDKQMFFKYLSQNSGASEIIQDSSLAKYEEKQKNSPYTTDAKFTVVGNDVNLNNTSISYTGSTDKVNKYEYRNVNLNYSNTDTLSIHYLNMQDYYGIKIDNVVNKYIAIENNNLKAFLSKMGVAQDVVDQFPDKIDFDNLDFNLFTEQEIATLKSKYSTILLNNLTESMFSKSETETSKIYTLTLTQPEYMNIANKFLEEIKNDSIIIDKVKQTIMQNSNCTEEQANEYITELKNKIGELQDELNSGSNSSEQVLTINLYVENKKLTKLELSQSDDSKINILINDNSYQMEVYEQGTTTPSATLKIDKTKSDDSVEYSIVIATNPSGSSIASSGQSEIKCDFKFTGLSTLSQVTEQSTLTIDDKTYTYTNTKQFGNITQEDVTVDQMLFLNTAPSAENIQNLFEQISTRTSDITTTYRTNSGFATDPFLEYAPAIIPYVGLKAIQAPTSTSTVLYTAGGIAAIYGIQMYSSVNSMMDNNDLSNTLATTQLSAAESTCNFIASQASNSSDPNTIDDTIINKINEEINLTQINSNLGLTDGTNGVDLNTTEHTIKLTCSTGSYVIGTVSNGTITWGDIINP